MDFDMGISSAYRALLPGTQGDAEDSAPVKGKATTAKVARLAGRGGGGAPLAGRGVTRVAGKGGGAALLAGGGDNKKRGRPSRGKKESAIDALHDFSQCPNGVQYFADEDNFRRALQRIQKLYVDTLVESGETALDEVNVISSETVAVKKQLNVAMDIAKAWAKHKSFNQEFAHLYKQSVQFLQLDPVAANPAPRWLAQLALAKLVEEFACACGVCSGGISSNSCVESHMAHMS
jgi:hypothetical protein